MNGPCRPTISWATWAAAACCSPSGSSRPCSAPAARVTGRSSTRRCSRAPSLLGTGLYGLMAMGLYDDTKPGDHFIDTGSHFYDVYETADGRYVAVGAIEPQFYAQLLAGLGLDPATLPKQMDRRSWPDMKRRLAEIFRTRPRAEWERVFAGTDACVSPVLSPLEAAAHAARGRPRELRLRRWRGSAGAGAEIQPHPRRDLPPPGVARRRYRARRSRPGASMPGGWSRCAKQAQSPEPQR